MLDDDFVLTISDREEDVPDFETQLVGSPSSPHSQHQRKRKRDHKLAAQNGQKHKKKKLAPDGDKATPKESSIDDEDADRTTDAEDDGAMNSDFEFQVGDTSKELLDDFDAWATDPLLDVKSKGGNRKAVDIDDIIARRQTKNGNGSINGDVPDVVSPDRGSVEAEDSLSDGLNEEEASMPDDVSEEDAPITERADVANGLQDPSEDVQDDDDRESDEESVAAPVPHPDDLESDKSEAEKEDPAELRRRAAFFAPEESAAGNDRNATEKARSFQSMSLSRPILKGLAAVGFTEPTPIQAKAVPLALLGKDIVGGAVTGSGKTAAFIIPILERLLYRPRKVATTRVAILMPTRELAVQCFNVSRKLASFTDITFAQIVGGFSLREQEQVLRSRPDVVIATPGRFIDHMRNSASFAVDSLEILVLDEADRMLEDGFADELTEILKTIPKTRQTMLFSATMTDTVDKLVRVGLNRPVRLMVDPKKQTVTGLVQEFVRIRPGREDKRLAYLMYLCEKVYTDRVIIFFLQKREAHRARVMFGLCGFKTAELHGSMSQQQRIESVEAFRSGKASFLLATDLASRGLDIKNVSTVLNYSAPQSHEIYLHRVGRTARAGRTGRSCTIAAEPDRKVVRAAVRAARAQGASVRSRVVPTDAIDAWAERLATLETEVEAVLAEEKTEKAMQDAERDVQRGENLVVHEAEIKARPRRTWFESERDKRAAKEAGRAELNGTQEGRAKKEKKKLSGKEKKKLVDRDTRTEGRMWKKGSAERAANKASARTKPSHHKKKGEGVKKGKPLGTATSDKRRPAR